MQIKLAKPNFRKHNGALFLSSVGVLYLQFHIVTATSTACTFRVCLNPDNYFLKKIYPSWPFLPTRTEEIRFMCWLLFFYMAVSADTCTSHVKPCERQLSESLSLPINGTLLSFPLNPCADTFDCLWFKFFVLMSSDLPYSSPSQMSSFQFCPTPISALTLLLLTLSFPLLIHSSPLHLGCKGHDVCCHWLYPFVRSLTSFQTDKGRKTCFLSALPPCHNWRQLTALPWSPCVLLTCSTALHGHSTRGLRDRSLFSSVLWGH